MHGTRYISKIREDLTFEVYNLWPDYVYPGRIIRINIEVTGEPESDKQITIELELHSESDLDAASQAYTRIFSPICTRFAPSGLTTKKSTTTNRSGGNMSISAVRKPSVMMFQCEPSIGHYIDIPSVMPSSE